jgi:hypothetical protein
MMGKIIGKSATFGDFGATFDCWRLFFNHIQPYKRDGLVEMTALGWVETTNQTSCIAHIFSAMCLVNGKQ